MYRLQASLHIVSLTHYTNAVLYAICIMPATATLSLSISICPIIHGPNLSSSEHYMHGNYYDRPNPLTCNISLL